MAHSLTNLPHATMAKPLELKNAQGDVFLTLSYRKSFYEAKWRGHLTADDVVRAAKWFLELAEANTCQKLLNDKSEATGDWQEANDWLEFEWIPGVVNAGLRCMAHVYSQNMMSSSSEYDLYKRAAPQLQLNYFTDLAVAESWLENCQP